MTRGSLRLGIPLGKRHPGCSRYTQLASSCCRRRDNQFGRAAVVLTRRTSVQDTYYTHCGQEHGQKLD